MTEIEDVDTASGGLRSEIPAPSLENALRERLIQEQPLLEALGFEVRLEFLAREGSYRVMATRPDLSIYLICSSDYPQKAPEVTVGRRLDDRSLPGRVEGEILFSSAVLKNWTAANHLLDVVEEVMADVGGVGKRSPWSFW